MSQYSGVVRWFNNAKGYGFLARDGGPDVFVHYSAIQADGYKSLSEGDTVEYDIVQGQQGLQADHIRRSEFQSINPRIDLPLTAGNKEASEDS